MQDDAADQVVSVFQYPVGLSCLREWQRRVNWYLEQAFFQKLDDDALIVAR